MARTHILKGFSDIESALWIHKHAAGLTIPEMVRDAQANGLSVTDTANFEAAQVITELGLAVKASRTLTASGDTFYKLWQTRRTDAVDILHGLQYGLWTPSKPGENVASWAYRTICQYLWHQQRLPDTADSLARYVQNQRSAVDTIPPDVGNAFSQKSILDAYDWLAPLEPPVLHGIVETGAGRSFRQAAFRRREYCSTPLFVMALDHLVREQGQQYGDLVVLDGDNLESLCCYCLIEESAVQLMMDDALRRYPQLLSHQRGWSDFVGLDRPPVFEDFL